MRVLALVVVLVLSACASRPSHTALEELAGANQGKLLHLSLGMSRNDVLKLMGSQTARTHDGIVNNPWTVETSVGRSGAQYETLYYVTRKNQPFTPVRKSLATPIVLRDGKVIGWGENALSRID